MIINVSFHHKPIYLQFEYPNAKATDPLTIEDLGNERFDTLCRLLEYEPVKKAEHMTQLGHGFAYCHPNDKPDKEKGRKVALAKAMDSASEFNGIPLYVADNRREVWNAYHSRSPKYSSYINNGKGKAA
jgi:hypothetical protein